jgi:hypothetical protein
LSGLFLCNKHRLQYKIYGKIIDNNPSKREKKIKECSICGSSRDVSYYNKNNLHILLCGKHKKQFDKYGEVHETAYFKNIKDKCEVCGSVNKLCLWKGKITLCGKHYCQMHDRGIILPYTRKDRNEIVVYDNYAEIILKDDQYNESGRALISIDKLNMTKKHKWHLGGGGYAVALINEKTEQLHRYILNIKDDKFEVDHINRDRLDCQNDNLRVCSKLHNNFNNSIYKSNTSGYHGITWHKKLQKWRVRISVNNERISLGCYYSFDDALKVRLKAEEKYFGEFAPKIIK